MNVLKRIALKLRRRLFPPYLRLWLGSAMTWLGLAMQVRARSLILGLYPELAGETYYRNLQQLHRAIDRELAKQKSEYPHFIYEQGYLYQAYHSLGIFGSRSTETRFDDYGLADLIHPGDRVLDIGCNCGFMLIHTAYRTGCSGEGIDINPYMINIGKHVAEFLGLSSKVNLDAKRFQDFQPTGMYNAIFSFASHWTDDEQLRPDFGEYMKQIHALLAPGGVLVFESHTADIDNPAFDSHMERQREWFDWNGSKLLYNRQRGLYIMRKKSAVGSSRAGETG
ncbi:MAG TPA: class I SAM-dependent methyltransferase [Anaerolineales bacterium]|nr:class I SAM-dependent methyltransferase [Anaerolineales bacterium]